LKTNRINKLKIVLAVSSGFLLTLSFPKTGISWLAWFALVPLLVAIRDISPKEGLYLGLCAGFVHYISLVYWLAYTMKTYGHLPLYLSVLILLLLSAYLALYVGIFSFAFIRLCTNPSFVLIAIPLIWVSLEYIRTFFLTGFPWELIGYTQFDTLHMIQIADIFGVYGVSFCIALSNAVIFLAFLYFTKNKWQEKAVKTRLTAGSIISLVLIFGLVWFYGKWRIQSIHELTSDSPSVRVTVVQGNIGQDKKWSPAFQRASTEKYITLSLSAKDQKPNIIVWPETATPFYFLYNRGLSKIVKKGINDTGVDFLFGSPSFRRWKNKIEYYNSAYLVSPEGNIFGKYDKVHLVPFGEYVPLKKFLPFLGKIVEHVGDFRSGEKGHTIKWGEYRLGIQICYEIIFPNLSRAMAKNNAALLVNITNDAWFGRSSAPYQHFSMAIFRAVENRRSIIRSANTGISGFIDPIGRVVASTQLFTDAIMTRTVPMLNDKTFYTRFGDLFGIACLALTLIASLYQSVRYLSQARRNQSM
jgi:apolipoprotein N-acyltransferase